MDLRALARAVLSRRASAEAGTRICEPAADLDRDQRHLLRIAEAGELRQMARGDAGELRILAERHPLRHEPQGAGRSRLLDRALLRQRFGRTERQARTGQLAVSPDEAF